MIKEAMREKERNSDEKDDDEPTRGMVVIQNIPGFTPPPPPQFNKIPRTHGIKVANKAGRIAGRVKDLTKKAKTPF